MTQRYSEYKSSGIEWIGDIPSHWKVSKTKYLTKNLDGQRVPLSSEERGDREKIYPYWGSNGVIDFVDEFIFDGEFVLVGEDGSPFFDKLKDVCFYVNEKVWVNNHIHILRPFLNKVNPRFLTHSFNITDYKSYITGSTRDKLTQSDLNTIVHVLPPIPEQEQIVKYLDEKTTQIDQLISITEKKIEGLKEKRTSLINHVLTKGLDSNVEMKDSGVEWIGEIPKHWSTKKLKYLVKICNGSDFKDHTVDEGGFPVYGTGGEFSRSSKFIYDKPSVLLGRKGTVDKPQFVEHPFWTSDTVYYTEIKDIVNPVFLFHLVCQIKFDLYVYGSAIPSMTKSVYDEMVFPYPPISEQTRIVDFVNDQTNKIDNLISIEKKRIETLKEYRQSLISEVVTGKLKVS